MTASQGVSQDLPALAKDVHCFPQNSCRKRRSLCWPSWEPGQTETLPAAFRLGPAQGSLRGHRCAARCFRGRAAALLSQGRVPITPSECRKRVEKTSIGNVRGFGPRHAKHCKAQASILVHPDKNCHPDSTRAFQRVAAAWATLSDEEPSTSCFHMGVLNVRSGRTSAARTIASSWKVTRESQQQQPAFSFHKFLI